MRCALWISGLMVIAACGFPRPKELVAIDAAPDASGDAEPCTLVLSDVTPKVIYEGQGTGGSAPALLVIRGNHLVNVNLAVELVATDRTTAVQRMPVAGVLASGDHSYLAFTVVAPVDDQLGNLVATDVPLDVTVRQDAPVDGSCTGSATQTLSGQLVLRALPELTNPQDAAGILYSRIELGNLDHSGFGLPEPLALNAVSSITLGSISVSASGAQSGPGAYSAGATPGPGGGGDGGNASGLLGTGGGGGGAGFASAGGPGGAGGATGGAAGRVTGEDSILSVTKNRASAGGRGGGGMTLLGGPLAPGGAGGGGGGFLLLAAGGDITIGDVFAAGGNGADSGGAGGGGGAGAGGTVVVRSRSGKLTLASVRVPAGSPGSPGGGAASAGRVRWDSPVGEAPNSPDRAAHRGPSFPAPPRVITARDQAFTLFGSPDDEMDIEVRDDRDVSHDAGHTRVRASGTTTITPQLFPGYNQLCAKLSGAAASESVAQVCIGIAFLP